MSRKRRPSELATLVLRYLATTDAWKRDQFVRKVRRYGAAIQFKSGHSLDSIALSNPAWTASDVEREIRTFMNEQDAKR